MSAGKCKRGPEVLLGGATSSSSDDDSPRSEDTSTTTATSTDPASPASAQTQTTISHEHDVVSSPGSSSTLSGGGGGQSDVRLPGFSQHSQPMSRRPRVKKKKADLNVASASGTGDILCALGPTPAGHSEQTSRQLASSRHQLTPRTKPPRGPSLVAALICIL